MKTLFCLFVCTYALLITYNAYCQQTPDCDGTYPDVDKPCHASLEVCANIPRYGDCVGSNANPRYDAIKSYSLACKTGGANTIKCQLVPENCAQRYLCKKNQIGYCYLDAPYQNGEGKPVYVQVNKAVDVTCLVPSTVIEIP